MLLSAVDSSIFLVFVHDVFCFNELHYFLFITIVGKVIILNFSCLVTCCFDRQTNGLALCVFLPDVCV